MISPPHAPDRVHAELADVLGRLFKAMKTRLPLEVPGLGRVTSDQFGVLACLADSGGSTMGELAAARSIALNSATALIDRLVQNGFVTREQAASDRRVVVVKTTPAGAQLVAGLRSRREQHLRLMVAALAETEIDAIRAAMPALDRLSGLILEGPRS